MIIIYLFLFCVGPVAITVINIKNLISKKKIVPSIMVLLTTALGGMFYAEFLEFCNVTSKDWNEAVVEDTFHSVISHEFLPSFVIIAVVGFAGLFIISHIPARSLSPLVAAFSIAAVILGNVLNVLLAIHVVGLLFPFLLLYHLNLLLLSVQHINEQILGQIEIQEKRMMNIESVWKLKLYSFLCNVAHWNIFAFACIFPLAAVIEIILILIGQGADGAVKAFTMTADWTFSTQTPPPPIEYSGHYLCTVAAGGHKKIVKPLRTGHRHGAKILVNRQLMVANAFEELVAEKMPALHKKIRRFYDRHGYPLSRLITTPLRADIVYILMKPLEWFFAFILYLLCVNPEERISRQYR